MERVTFALLHRRLASINFDGWDAIKEVDVYSGAPHCYAMFLRSILSAFPSVTASLMRKHTWFCIEEDDRALGQAILRLLSLEYGYKFPITPAQFGSSKFASAKMKVCLDLFDLLQRRSAPHAAHAPAAGYSNIKGALVVFNSSSPKEKSTTEILRERLDEIDKRKRLLNHIQRD